MPQNLFLRKKFNRFKATRQGFNTKTPADLAGVLCVYNKLLFQGFVLRYLARLMNFEEPDQG